MNEAGTLSNFVKKSFINGREHLCEKEDIGSAI